MKFVVTGTSGVTSARTARSARYTPSHASEENRSKSSSWPGFRNVGAARGEQHDEGGDDATALRAARALAALGYTNVHRLAGGIAQRVLKVPRESALSAGDLLAAGALGGILGWLTNTVGSAILGLLVGAGGALSPVLAAVLHNASSVAVVANSSRLIRYRLD